MLRPDPGGRADVVFGSRFTGEERKVLYFWHTLANQFLTLMSNMLNDTNWTDMETCYKAFIAEVLRPIPLESNRFGIEPELAAKVARNRLRMFEVPINYNGRSYDEGKKITWRDGVAALWFILKYRFTLKLFRSRKGDARRAGTRARNSTNGCTRACSPGSGDRVAELGVGRGNLSRFIRRHDHVLLTDYRLDYLADLQGALGEHPDLQHRQARYDRRARLRATARLSPRRAWSFSMCSNTSRTTRAVLAQSF